MNVEKINNELNSSIEKAKKQLAAVLQDFPLLTEHEDPTLLALKQHLKTYISVLEKTIKILNTPEVVIKDEGYDEVEKILFDENNDLKDFNIDEQLDELKEQEYEIGEENKQYVHMENPPRRAFKLWKLIQEVDGLAKDWLNRGTPVAIQGLDVNEIEETDLDQCEEFIKETSNGIKALVKQLEEPLDADDRKKWSQHLDLLAHNLSGYVATIPTEQPSRKSATDLLRKTIEENIRPLLKRTLGLSDYKSLENSLSTESSLLNVQADLLSWIQGQAQKRENGIPFNQKEYDQNEEMLEKVQGEYDATDALHDALNEFTDPEELELSAYKDEILEELESLAKDPNEGIVNAEIIKVDSAHEELDPLIKKLQKECSATKDQACATWYLINLKTLAMYKQSAGISKNSPKTKESEEIKRKEDKLFDLLGEQAILSRPEPRLSQEEITYLKEQHRVYRIYNENVKENVYQLPIEWEKIEETVKAYHARKNMMKERKSGSILFQPEIKIHQAGNDTVSQDILEAQLMPRLPELQKKRTTSEVAKKAWAISAAETSDPEYLNKKILRKEKTIQGLQKALDVVTENRKEEAGKYNNAWSTLVDITAANLNLRNKLGISQPDMRTEANLREAKQDKEKIPNRAPEALIEVNSTEEQQLTLNEKIQKRESLIQQLQTTLGAMKNDWEKEVIIRLKIEKQIASASDENKELKEKLKIKKELEAGPQEDLHIEETSNLDSTTRGEKRKAIDDEPTDDHAAWSTKMNKLLPEDYRQQLLKMTQSDDVGPITWAEDGKKYSCIPTRVVILNDGTRAVEFLRNQTEGGSYSYKKPRFLLMTEAQLPENIKIDSIVNKDKIDVKQEFNNKPGNWQDITTERTNTYKMKFTKSRGI